MDQVPEQLFHELEEDIKRPILQYGHQLRREYETFYADGPRIPGYRTQPQDSIHQLTILMWDRSSAFRTAVIEATSSWHDTQMERCWMRDENDSNQHHRAFEEPTDMMDVYEGVGRGVQEASEEQGRAYMHGLQLEYGGEGFGHNTEYGQCVHCGKGIPV